MEYGRSRKGVSPFITEVRRYGEWFGIGKPTTKGRALKRGAKYVETTLGAAFRIKEVKGRIKQRDIGFIVPEKVFRRPKVRGIETAEPTFIQRGGKETTFVKGARLATLGEKREIALLRSKRLGRTKFL
jgi:hypothetical protein